MRRNIILIALILSVALIFTSCDSASDNGVATVRVMGTVASTESTRAADTSLELMADIKVNGTPLTINDFKNEKGSALQAGSNQELVAKVEVPSSKVTLTVAPKKGFIFDEWEFDRRATPRLSWRERREIEKILDPIEEHETIEVPTKYTKYIRATYDRGYYVTLSTREGKGDGTIDNPFTIEELKTALDNRFDDELTIKVTGNGALDLSSFNKFNKLEEIKIIGYKDAVITSITLPDYNKDDFELEIRDLTINNLDASILPTVQDDDDVEIEFENVVIKSLDNTKGRTFANMQVELIKKEGGTFVNSVLPYFSGTKYYHSLIITDRAEDAEKVDIEGKNNIVVVDTLPTKKDPNNLYITRAEYNKDPNPWKVDPAIVKDKVINAKALNDDWFPEQMEDFIEEDAFGRDRPEKDDGIPVSYGPYEYQDWDD